LLFIFDTHMHLFYTPQITSDTYTLEEEESKHAIRVLRLAPGDFIYLLDGVGGFYKARICDASAKGCTVKIVETHKEYGKRSFYLHIAIAPTKNIARIEWFLEKATELGIDEITALKCEHSERIMIKPERLHKITVSAIKQSVKAYLPRLNEMEKFKPFIKQPFTGQKFIAHCISSASKPHLKNCYTKGQNALILIGPEGDFTPEEVELATQNGFREISLGPSRLRTETAGLAACHVINILNE